MARLLEILNGVALIPATILLLLMVRYLIAESVRRGLHSFSWFHLPPSMNLVLAMFFFDLAIMLRLIATFLWYLIGQRLFPIQMLFFVAIIGLIIGLLCKIRAITEPEYGRLPWFATMMVTIAVAATLLIF